MTATFTTACNFQGFSRTYSTAASYNFRFQLGSGEVDIDTQQRELDHTSIRHRNDQHRAGRGGGEQPLIRTGIVHCMMTTDPWSLQHVTRPAPLFALLLPRRQPLDAVYIAVSGYLSPRIAT